MAVLMTIEICLLIINITLDAVETYRKYKNR
jgi:hypothetical protein